MSELASENSRKTVPRTYVLVLLFFTVAAGLAMGTYYYFFTWRETPRFALWQMVRAIQANDTQTLFQYIDIPSIADHLVTSSAGDVDSWLLNKGLGATQQEDDVSRLARSLTKKFARFITPKVIAALEPQIKAGVEKYLAELNTLEKAGLSALPAKAEIQQEDGVASVTLTDPGTGKKFHFRMARPADGNKWRIVEIDYQNVRSIIERKFME
jgi:hypothetical protein